MRTDRAVCAESERDYLASRFSVTGLRYSRRMANLHVESWSPDYGSPYESDAALAEPERVDETVEVPGKWEPISGVDDGISEVAFVDGVRRVDARLTLDEPGSPVPGLCGSYAVGAVLWNRSIPRSEVIEARVSRLAVFAAGKGAPIPVVSPELSYRSESVPDSDPAALITRFHGAMRRAEGELSEELAMAGRFVVSDGPINTMAATDKVGFIKSHRAPYLSAERSAVIARLGVAERTPLFLIGRGGTYERYSWYFRIAQLAGGHSWTGVVRGEVSAGLEKSRALTIAARTTAIIPAVASESHIDPRAPQNLVPIAALERELRRRLGDPGYVYRALRSAIMRTTPAGVT